MAKMKTPYDTLLRVRRIEEEKAKAALAVANHAQRAAAATLEDRRAYYASAAAQPDGETDLSAFRRAVAHALHRTPGDPPAFPMWAGCHMR